MTGSISRPIDRRSWTHAVTAGIFVVLAAVVALTFQDYGISWDEELHVPYGHKLLAYYMSGFADRSAFSFINLYQYGGFFDLLSAAASRLSPFGEYETRHLIGGLFFLAGLYGAWKLATLLAGARAGLMAVACLATTPLLYGHSFINPKDAPLAWLGVWVAYFTCRMLGEARASWRSIAGLGVSLGLALGMRIIAFAFIGQIATVIAIRALAFVPALGVRGAAAKTLRDIRPFAPVFALAFAVMALVWPWSVQAPLNIVSVFTDSANLYWHPDMLWAGEIVNSADLPPRYLVTLFAVQLPEYVLLGAGLIAAWAFAQARHLRAARFTAAPTLQYLYVALTVVVPLAAFAAFRPSTYNGVRHFLFVAPQLIVLAAIGLDRALIFLERRGRALALGFAALLAAALVREIILMARLHPYQYLAFNSLAGGLHGAYGRYELDYWGVSYKEATLRLAQFLADERAAGRAVPEKALVFVCGANTSAGSYLPPAIGLTDDRTKADFFMGGDLTNPRCRVRPEGRAVVEVKRMDAVLSYVLDLRGGRP